MMVNYKLIIVLISVMFFFSCLSSSDESDEHEVFGQVLYEGNPAENVIVTIEAGMMIQAKTDLNGKFRIFNVPTGNYKLTISSNHEYGGFSERSDLISVFQNTELSNLILPDPVRLLEPEIISDNQIKLTWTSSKALDFREYKLYYHDTSGLDETTGTLAHVATSRNDTVFVLNDVNPFRSYFFRVFIMNDFGRLGGSNIISAEIDDRLIIMNGDFEYIDPGTGVPEYWEYFANENYYFVDTNYSQSGNKSIRIENSPGGNVIFQDFDALLLAPGEDYLLKYWVKHDAAPNAEFAVILSDEEFSWVKHINHVNGTLPESDWQEYEFEFTAPNLNTNQFTLAFYFYAYGNNDVRAWIDNFSIVRID